MLRFPRLANSIDGLTPGPPMPWVTRPRYPSPVTGCSTLMTSAPQSASSAPATGTNTQLASSTTFTPLNSPADLRGRSPRPLPRLHRREAEELLGVAAEDLVLRDSGRPSTSFLATPMQSGHVVSEWG